MRHSPARLQARAESRPPAQADAPPPTALLRRKLDRGVTLIELLVVITILGVLAAIVTFSVAGLQSNGNTAACKTDTSTIRTAQEAYRSQNPGYASNVAALVTAGFLNGNSEWHEVVTPGTGTPAAPFDVITKTGVTKCGGDGVATHVVDNVTYF